MMIFDNFPTLKDSLIIPMDICAYKASSPEGVPRLNPDYSYALSDFLAKGTAPAPFNADITLLRGVHLHFILPSALKHGTESGADKTLEFPEVPDRYIITRMYCQNGKIVTDIFVTESNFYSLSDNNYANGKGQSAVTIPKFNETDLYDAYRYLGRQYKASETVPMPIGRGVGYLDKLTAIGPGDPIFSAYYPSCNSVFGFYDNLDGVPEGAVLTYAVIGLYSNTANDILSGVKTTEDMNAFLQNNNFEEESEDIKTRTILFGAVSSVDIKKPQKIDTGTINIGFGESSGAALSAIVASLFPDGDPDFERFLTSLIYGTQDEKSQPDGNFKIDDDCHYRGFERFDAFENTPKITIPKTLEDDNKQAADDIHKKFSDIASREREIGKLRRLLDRKKEALYAVFEQYEDAENRDTFIKIADVLMGEISTLRSEISSKIDAVKNAESELNTLITSHGGSFEITAADFFFTRKDPAVMLFGEDITRFVYDEGTLFCNTKPFSATNFTRDDLLKLFLDVSSLNEDFTDLLITALLLDKEGLQKDLNINPTVNSKFSPSMINLDSNKNITLLMEWQSQFYQDYTDSDPKNSVFNYGETDYTYGGGKGVNASSAGGFSVITPHCIYTLSDTLKRYFALHPNPEIDEKIIDKIKGLQAVSQALGGINAQLSQKFYVGQFPINIDPDDSYAQVINSTLFPEKYDFPENPPARDAISDSPLYPISEGFLNIPKLSILSTFGHEREVLDDKLIYKGKKYFSERFRTNDPNIGFLPLCLSSPTRTNVRFISSDGGEVSGFTFSSPIIAIFVPDMLSRNLNIFSPQNEFLGIIKTVYRMVSSVKKPFARFVPAPKTTIQDNRITDFIAKMTDDSKPAFYELMQTIDEKLHSTIQFGSDDFIFGRTLVLADIALSLEIFGMPEFDKRAGVIGNFNDNGLSQQAFTIEFGDRERVTDGFVCGFEQGNFNTGFVPFGLEKSENIYLSEKAPQISADDGEKIFTMLFDPTLKINFQTGFLPAFGVSLPGFYANPAPIFQAEINNIISGEASAELPDFSPNEKFTRRYLSGTEYKTLQITKPAGNVSGLKNNIITDGFIVRERGAYER
jgi:hypothetical protein